MSRFLGKLAFIHRRLWSRDGLYRAAVLLGPAPLLGTVAAGTVWWIIQVEQVHPKQLPPWAVAQRPELWDASGEPTVLRPAYPLPPPGPDGMPVGLEEGWRVTANPIEISPTMDVDVKPTPLAAISVDSPVFDMSQIMAGAPEGSLYVAGGIGFLAVKTAGTYALTVRFERPEGFRADCLVRLVFGPHRIVSEVEVNVVNSVSRTFNPAQFSLQPGLYPIGWAFGCWQGHEVTGPGRMTLLIRHPGEPSPLPARPDDIVRPKRIQP